MVFANLSLISPHVQSFQFPPYSASLVQSSGLPHIRLLIVGVVAVQQQPLHLGVVMRRPHLADRPMLVPPRPPDDDALARLPQGPADAGLPRPQRGEGLLPLRELVLDLPAQAQQRVLLGPHGGVGEEAQHARPLARRLGVGAGAVPDSAFEDQGSACRCLAADGAVLER